MKKILQSDTIFHLLIWLLLIVPKGLGSVYIAKSNFGLYLFNLFVQNGVLLILIYINLLYLIPKFYQARKYTRYYSLLILLSVLQIAITFWINDFVSAKMNMTEMSDWRWELPFYGFSTAQYLVISFLLFAAHERFKQRELIDDMQVQKLNAEVNYLKAQINPHFLFNTLNNLYALSLEKSDKAPEAILMLSNMMDYMLYEASASRVSLKKEIENIEHYIGLERLRQGNDAKINYVISGTVGDQKIVPLLLLPLIENAMKHGVNQLIRNAFIDILLEIEGKHLRLKVKNNYRKADNHSSHGIGLINLRKQLDQYYSGNYTFTIDDRDTEYSAELNLNLV